MTIAFEKGKWVVFADIDIGLQEVALLITRCRRWSNDVALNVMLLAEE